MAEYIKREDVLKRMTEVLLCDSPYCQGKDECEKMAERYLEDSPSIVIVHCKDCKYWGEEECPSSEKLEDEYDGTDYLTRSRLAGNDYCSYGEREE